MTRRRYGFRAEQGTVQVFRDEFLRAYTRIPFAGFSLGRLDLVD